MEEPMPSEPFLKGQSAHDFLARYIFINTMNHRVSPLSLWHYLAVPVIWQS